MNKKEVPSLEEIEKFVDVFDRLCTFEAEHRLVRNWGVSNEGELPIPEVIRVRGWLTKMVDRLREMSTLKQ